MNGTQQRDFAGDPGPVPLSARVGYLSGLRRSTHGPTRQHRAVLGLAGEELTAVRADLARIEAELEDLGVQLDRLGVPWTPGRSGKR
jgi:hypothetical protein